jgi:hypothetical protein
MSLQRGFVLKTRKLVASLSAAGLFAFGAAAPASAQPIITGGLINVTVNDVNVGVQVPIGIAANVCDLNVAALVAAIHDEGDSTCDATATSTADLMQDLPAGWQKKNGG